MKAYLLFFALLVPGLSASAQNAVSYTVRGQAGSVADGTKVYLFKAADRTQTRAVVTDSATVQGHAFVMRGQLPEPEFRVLSITSERNQTTPLFLDNGEIQVQYADGSFKVSGTPNNEVFYGFNQKVKGIYDRMQELGKVMRDENTSKEQLESAQKEDKFLQEEYVGLCRTTIQDNVQNLAGAWLFKSLGAMFSDQEKTDLLKQMSPHDKQDAGLDLMELTAVGQPYLDVALPDTLGQTKRLSDYVGRHKLVLLDFWASWCAPCLQAMPDAQLLYKKYHDKGFEIIGISLDKDAARWKGAIKRLSLPWPQLSDLQLWRNEGAATYGIHAIPHLILIGPDGRILANGSTLDEIEKIAGEVLGDDPAPNQ